MPVLLNKPVSRTPLEIVEEYRSSHPELKDEKIGYAGRLDPMAEGLLLLLVGDENKKRKDFEVLDKEYEFEVLFGISTDSYDVMGIIVEQNDDAMVDKEDVEHELKKLLGKQKQLYPPFSSAAVRGKPLYWWMRQNRLNEIEIPSKQIEVKEIEVLGWREVAGGDLAQTSIDRIEKVNGDFRQDEIIKQWRIVAERQTQVSYPVARCHVVCSSGTYVRGLAHSLGRALKAPSLAYSITRTRIGEYKR